MDSFPGKILLFGEYTLLYNQQALAMPFSKYFGKWSFETKPHNTPDLTPWLDYIEELSKKETWISDKALTKFSFDLENKLWFDSNIPQGYGLGSSGALVAAWYGRYIEQSSKESLYQLKERFSKLESFFHGTSSGFDPLVSYTKKPILQQDASITFLEEDRIELISNFFIIDTKIPRSTEPLVKWFRENIEGDQSFEEQVKVHLVPAQQSAIEAFVAADKKLLLNAVKKISEIQLINMKRLIPDHLLEVWKTGLDDSKYFIKLCGAGGGGVMLGFGKFQNDELLSFPLV